MPWHSLIFNAALLSCFIYAWLYGGCEERIAASTAVIAALATLVAFTASMRAFETVERSVLLIDLATLAIFVGLTLRSERHWPACAAGLQAASIMVHTAKAVTSTVSPFAYVIGMAFWGYGVLAAIAFGTWRCPRKIMPR